MLDDASFKQKLLKSINSSVLTEARSSTDSNQSPVPHLDPQPKTSSTFTSSSSPTKTSLVILPTVIKNSSSSSITESIPDSKLWRSSRLYHSISNLQFLSLGRRWKQSFSNNNSSLPPNKPHHSSIRNRRKKFLLHLHHPHHPTSTNDQILPSPVLIHEELFSHHPHPTCRVSYDSDYTTIEYTESIRNSAGSELSFCCRGIWNPEEVEEGEVEIRSTDQEERCGCLFEG